MLPINTWALDAPKSSPNTVMVTLPKHTPCEKACHITILLHTRGERERYKEESNSIITSLWTISGGGVEVGASADVCDGRIGIREQGVGG